MRRPELIAVSICVLPAVVVGWLVGHPESCETSCPQGGGCRGLCPSAAFHWHPALLIGGIVLAVLSLLAVSAVRALSDQP